MKVPTASVYCSRKRASAIASRNARWPICSVYHAGRGSDPVIVVGNVIVSVGLFTAKFYPEGAHGESRQSGRLRGTRRDGRQHGGPADGERPQGHRLQPHGVE